MVITYEITKEKVIEDSIILEKLVEYINKTELLIESEDEFHYILDDFMESNGDIFLEDGEVLKDFEYEFTEYAHLVDSSNYVANPYKCCDDFKHFPYCPICGTKLN